MVQYDSHVQVLFLKETKMIVLFQSDTLMYY